MKTVLKIAFKVSHTYAGPRMAVDLSAWQEKTDKRVNEENDEDFIAKHGDLRPTLAGHEQHVLSSFEADNTLLHRVVVCRASSTLTRQTGLCTKMTPRRGSN